MCANNYLGLAEHPRVLAAAKQSLDQLGFGMASVRFICGTQAIHRQLEETLSQFLGAEETILYSSCFDANGGLFETLLTAEDAIISDELNHASIIDGIRLCKAARFRYKNNDMADLEAQLKQTTNARFRMIATDGVFSMDGTIANLPAICELADKYDALVMVDDSHAVGSWASQGGARTSIIMSWIALTFSLARWAKPWVVLAAAISQVGVRSLICCASGRVLISSPILWHRHLCRPR